MSGGAPFVQPIGGDESPKEAKILCIADLEQEGSKRLSPMYREFYNSGSTDQFTIRANSSSMDKLLLRSRVLVDVKSCNPGTYIWDQKLAFPLGVAPAGLAGIAHADAENATARACHAKGVPMGISSFANKSVADIRKNGPSVPLAMQLYTMKNRALMERMIRRAEDAGCKAIFLTADSPVIGVRYNEGRNDFRIPSELGLPNMEMDVEEFRKQTHEAAFREFNDDGHNWERDIPWIRARTKMQIFIKGVLCPEDVEKAVEAGCDGVVVSNHGGRQLDGVPATIDALPGCVDAAKGRLQVHVDGGFRRGADVFRALALGAECVWVGRPALWGLAYDGQAGVEKMLDILRDEFTRCMALCGCRTVKDINRSCLARINADGVLAKL